MKLVNETSKAQDEEEIAVLNVFNQGHFACILKRPELAVEALNREIVRLVPSWSWTRICAVSQWDQNCHKRLMKNRWLMIPHKILAIQKARESRCFISA